MQHMFDYILELIKDRVFLRIKEKIYKEIWLLWQHNSNFSWHQVCHQDSQLFIASNVLLSNLTNILKQGELYRRNNVPKHPAIKQN